MADIDINMQTIIELTHNEINLIESNIQEDMQSLDVTMAYKKSFLIPKTENTIWLRMLIFWLIL